ncbi:helix-turn-helix domain-containing protein [Kordia sp. YSTF-M3]|uniref:Helix-turn-helix domain-containing protein n=1 Tax=Kordia aestuariivivens TaxID=2759037 RepID=A0ABR7QAT5_9FLAO|nr:helix-turn-helix domain-containing protein [Kordia aestuariivivens]MBC8755660.1 helix-turn-helix domain-containing protein [Kordia aestuariivivens]
MKNSTALCLYKYICILFLCVPLFIYAQEQQLELKQFSFHQLDSLFELTKNSDLLKTEMYAQKMLSKAQESNDLDKITIAYYNLSSTYIRQGEKAKFKEAIDKLEYYALKAKDTYMLANCFNFKGNMAYSEGALERAFSHYKKVLELTKNSDDTYMSLVALNNIALIKKELQNPYEALKDVQTALHSYRKENDFYSEISALHLIGELHLDIYKSNSNPLYLDSVKTYIDSGLKKSQQHNDKEGSFLFLSTLGQWYQKTKQYENALSTFQEVLVYFEKNNDRKWTILLHLYLGRLYDELKDYNTVIEILEKANTLIADEDFYFNDAPEIYLLLAKNYSYINDQEKAEVNFEKFKKFSGKIQQDNQKLYAKLHETYDVKILEKKIFQLETKATRNLYTTIFITIFSILFFGYIAIFYYKKNRHNSKKLSEILEKIKKEEAPKFTSTINLTKIEDQEVKRILTALDELEKTEHFLSTSCTLNSVAKEIETNTSYLSKIVNTYKKKSFANYLNEYRINKVLVKLKIEKDYQQYTLKYIAEQFGFSRHETFSRVFKKQTGISPSYYLKKLKNDDL